MKKKDAPGSGQPTHKITASAVALGFVVPVVEIHDLAVSIVGGAAQQMAGAAATLLYFCEDAPSLPPGHSKKIGGQPVRVLFPH